MNIVEIQIVICLDRVARTQQSSKRNFCEWNRKCFDLYIIHYPGCRTQAIFMRNNRITLPPSAFPPYTLLSLTLRLLFIFMFMILFLSFSSSFFSSLILNKHIYIMPIIISLCHPLHFFTKRNVREKKTWREKREEIYIALSQPVEKLWSWNFLHILAIISSFYESHF